MFGEVVVEELFVVSVGLERERVDGVRRRRRRRGRGDDEEGKEVSMSFNEAN